MVKELLVKYKEVPPYSEEPDTYFDFDDDEKFSLIKYGQAECSAGLFDIIDIDQDTIAQKRKQLDEATSISVDETEKILHDIVFSENRMLLVTRGLDPRTDDDVYHGFVNEFINTGIVPAKYQILTDKARNNQPLLSEKALIYELADLLSDLYKNMDDSLQFKTTTSAPVEVAPAEEKKTVSASVADDKKASAIQPDVKKDFRGVACPMNFVKTKIALAPMQSGQILEILLDDGQPIANVPGSVKNEGHEVIATEKSRQLLEGKY